MSKGNLEAKISKAVLDIRDKVIDIDNHILDLSAKLCYIIKNRADYHKLPDSIDY